MRNIQLLSILCLFMLIYSCKSHPPQTTTPDKIVLAYVTSWKNTTLDPHVVTHINYAFGHVNDTFDGIRIDNETRLKQITALKSVNPSLKVLLSIGGWGSGGFSEMAADEEKRSSFASDCKRVMEEFHVDGIDIDWEYPTMGIANISASSDDTENFTYMMQDIRSAIGKGGLLTLASDASGKFINFRAIEPVVDFVNIMTYDINHPPYHHAAVYPSERTQYGSCQEAVEAHVITGFPIEKLVLGVPFFGHAVAPLPEYINYEKILQLEGYIAAWDETSCVPYLTDSLGQMVCSYEDSRSIAIKCDFVREKGMLGIMYWEYDSDDKEGTLRRAVYNGMKE